MSQNDESMSLLLCQAAKKNKEISLGNSFRRRCCYGNENEILYLSIEQYAGEEVNLPDFNKNNNNNNYLSRSFFIK